MTRGTSADAGDSSVSRRLRELTTVANEAWATENRATAQRLVASYALFRECSRQDPSGTTESQPGYAVVDPFDVCAGQVVVAMGIPTARAETMISFAVDLHERYPAILAAMRSGRMDQRTAELHARQMATVDPAVLATVQQEVVDDYLSTLEAGIRLGAHAVRNAVDMVVSRHDANAIRERREVASRTRGASIRRGTDGMATLWAHLTTGEVAVLSEAVDRRVAEHKAAEAAGAMESAVGTSVTDADEPRPHYSEAERRADALLSLICGEVGVTADQCGGHDTSGSATRLRPKVTVIAGRRTADEDAATVEFARTGEAALESLLGMLSVSDGASIERLDPAVGIADGPDREHRYRPSAELAKRIRLRDGTCRHPGCTASAEFADLDHVIPFDHTDPSRGGPTTEYNLMALCRRHHRFKTFSDWIYELRPDGTLVVLTGDGSTMITRPSGPLARYRQEQQCAEDAAWDRQQEHAPERNSGVAEPAAEPDFWTRRSARLHAERRRTERLNAKQNTDTDTAELDSGGRWWARNTPVTSPIEAGIESLLDEIINAPPF